MREVFVEAASLRTRVFIFGSSLDFLVLIFFSPIFLNGYIECLNIDIYLFSLLFCMYNFSKYDYIEIEAYTFLAAIY